MQRMTGNETLDQRRSVRDAAANVAGRTVSGVRRRLRLLVARSVDRGLPPSWVGYRWVRRETVRDHLAHDHRRPEPGRLEVVHPEAVGHNPLPRNVDDRGALPDDRGWWGFSFRDVPERTSGETFVATLPDCRVVWYRDPALQDDYHPAILTADGHALELREVRFRPLHADALRRSGPPVRIDKATWVLERVFHNHSHWLTAHLPKLLLLQQRGELGDVVLPDRRPPSIDGSLRAVGIDPGQLRTFDGDRFLEVGELTILGTDRFRPELLRLVQDAAPVTRQVPGRKVYISRSKATRRRLVNEEEVWPLWERAGFERVLMEELTVEDQVALMRETAVLAGPHGAGLTNMVFCPPGAQVVEIADLGFPNPNFYALASAVRHGYWLIEAEALGDGHPLERDLRVAPRRVRQVLEALPT